ncbi:MAG: hypothetical protein IKW67_00215 [Alphaproteobacteria bacterium]|nr:hypothetical protein [Alphaproteobacteria bacterium]
MKENIVSFLKKSFPFLLTIGLWRLSTPIWNPAGILAIIPIFYCSFIRPIPWFALFSVFMCFVIDYKFETICFWVAMYCLFYAINSFQNLIDIQRMDKNAIFAFLVFFGICIILQIFSNLSFINLINGIWIFMWVTLLYTPTVVLIKRIYHD